MASSLIFSLPPFLRILSQNEDNSSALELPATVLLQNTSNASFNAWKKLIDSDKRHDLLKTINVAKSKPSYVPAPSFPGHPSVNDSFLQFL
jgi:hypothetical protein